MCDSIYHMTQPQARFWKTLWLKVLYDSHMHQVIGPEKIAYGPARNLYWSMQVCSIKKIQKQMIIW